MTDREKVKKGLDLCLTGEPSTCKDCPYDAECKEARGIGPSPLRRDALELLKEQEAVEPKEIVNEHFPIGDYRRTIGWLCGKCGKALMGDGNYCSYCGQAVKWE